MTAYVKALIAFLRTIKYNGTALDVYQAGRVPSSAAFPYLTATIAQGDMFTTTFQTVLLWCKIGTGGASAADTQRAAILDTIRNLVPYQGYRLNYDGGIAMIYRNPADFTSYYDDPEDNTVIGARISLMITHYEE